ncbi:biotin transporter BioY [Microbacterium karelineae]|uniref:biotin transporter BioY n=1 Tax=Microbacterium karelineae TaxID=2654283 RepID=UPI0018D434CE|nr:biotin transporter BioY [Microbacterium karelineae]
MADTSRWEARDIARIAVFAGIIIVLGLMGPIPMPGLVPITAQTLGVMLAGAVLGWQRGAAAVLVVLLLVAVGLPVLAGGRGGLGIFVGPTAGYAIGWIFGAAAVGFLAHAGARRLTWWRVAIASVVGGIVVVYAFGIPVQAAVIGTTFGETVLTSLVFLPGDLIKAVLTMVLTMLLYRAYPPAFPASVRRARATPRAS